jgi:RNA polymerase sigma-70 factor (ECF subfamily)
MEEARPKLRLLSAALAEVSSSLTAERVVAPGLPLTAEQAFRRYSGYVAAVAFRILGSDEQIDDVVQDVFLVAVKDLGRLREPEAMKGWLATIAVRVAGRRLRLRRLRRLLGLGQPLDYELAVPAARPEARVLLGQIYTLLDELAVDKRLAWVLRHVQGEQLDEVARLCGCSLAAAKRRIDAAHQFLQRKLSDE